MKYGNTHWNRARLAKFAAAAVSVAASLAVPTAAWAQGTAAKPGLAGVLADDERVMSELSRRELKTLLDYAFDKNKVPKDKQDVYLTFSALKAIREGKLSPRQQQEQIVIVAKGVDKVLATMNDAQELLKFNKQLVDVGIMGPLNLLEYFGENPKLQAQVRPVAEAVVKVYAKAEQVSQKQADDIANRMTAGNQAQLAPAWEKVMGIVALAKFSGGVSHHALALSMDKADPNRSVVAENGIKLLAEFDNADSGVQPQARLNIAKLKADQAAKENTVAVTDAKAKFKEVLDDPQSKWDDKFQAVYFGAVTDLNAQDLVAGKAGLETVKTWLAANAPPGGEAALGAAQAAVQMLEFRLHSVTAEASTGDAKAKADLAAVKVLSDLKAKRPDLRSIINTMILARLPEKIDLAGMDVLTLQALVAQGEGEARKPAEVEVDKKVLRQAMDAATELTRRVGKDPKLSADDAEKCTFVLGFFQSRLGDDLSAAGTFLGFLEKYKNDRDRMQSAFDGAQGAVARLKSNKATAELSGTNDMYRRFLAVATAAPFNRTEFNLEYGKSLLDANLAAMEGSPTPAQEKQLLATAQKGRALFRAVPENSPTILLARFYEMLAFDQMLDLASADAATGDWIAQTQKLAAEVRERADAQMPAAKTPEDQARLRRYKVSASLVAANLAKHDRSENKRASFERALDLLANFEKDVEGLPNANALLGEALFVRVNGLMAIGKTAEALESLGKAVEAKPGDQGLDLLYRMLDALDKEFKEAEEHKDTPRMRELAGDRAKVSQYMVDRATQSKSPEIQKLVPRYNFFRAGTLEQAAKLEEDAGKRAKFLSDALGIYDQALKAKPDDASVQLRIALIQFELGEYAKAQPIFVQFLTEQRLGKPKVTDSGGERMIWNNQYWEVMASLLRSNVELAKSGAGGADAQSLRTQTADRLKQLYVQWGQPGGERWIGKFDALRKELLPDWNPPAITVDDTPVTTQPTPK